MSSSTSTSTTCDSCGCERFEKIILRGRAARRCALCGEIEGTTAAAGEWQEEQEALAGGVDHGIWPLVRALNNLDGYEVLGSSAGDSFYGTPPHVQLRIDLDGRSRNRGTWLIERLVQSLTLASRALNQRWVLQPYVQNSLAWMVKPACWDGSHALSASLIRELQADVSRLAEQLDMDCRLAWWNRN